MKLKIIAKMLLAQGRICWVTYLDTFHLATATVGVSVFPDTLADSETSLSVSVTQNVMSLLPSTASLPKLGIMACAKD